MKKGIKMNKMMGIQPWNVMTCNIKRVKEGVSKMRMALAEDAGKEAEKGLALPSDWRNRIIKHPKN